jgi:hypothetical protein
VGGDTSGVWIGFGSRSGVYMRTLLGPHWICGGFGCGGFGCGAEYVRWGSAGGRFVFWLGVV